MSIATEVQRLQQAKADIKTAIEGKGVEVGEITLDAYAAKIAEIESGGISQNPLQYVKSLNSVYSGVAFPENTELLIDIPQIESLSSTFQNATGIVNLKVKGNIANNAVNCLSAFRIATLEVLDLSEFNAKFSNAQNAFNNAKALKEIKGTLDFSECTSLTGTFNGCLALEEIRLKPLSVSLSLNFVQALNLSGDSVESVIGALVDLSGLTKQTLSFHSTVGAKLTDAQKATINAKNWTLEY